jgi:voltage-gated potassium channel
MYALVVLAVVFLLVVADRDGYRDTADGHVSVLDAAYYTTVTLSTTGYGDIVPVTNTARLINVALITPLRVLFLVILVGTTLEVLTRRTREEWRLARWRRSMRGHTVVVGYGTKGRSAIETLRAAGIGDSDIVVDRRSDLAAEANAAGLAALVGDATRSIVLRHAETGEAARIIVAPDRDDTAVLVTLTTRQLNPQAVVVAAVREAENAPLLRQSGADVVITSSETAGRLLGVATVHRLVADVIEDLLAHGKGLVPRPGPAGAGQPVSRDGPRAPAGAWLTGSRASRYEIPGAIRCRSGRGGAAGAGQAGGSRWSPLLPQGMGARCGRTLRWARR